MNDSPSSGTDAAKRLRKRRIISIVSIVILFLLFGLVGWFVGKPLVHNFRNPEIFREWVASHGFGGKLAMIGIMMLQIIVALIPGEPFELGAGYAFGAVEGTVLCLIGSALASALVFIVVKKYGMKLVELFFSKEKIESIAFLKNSKKLELITFILFLMPGTPKDVLTYFVGVTPMKLPAFLLITTVARIPSVLSSTLTGSMMGSKRYTFAFVTYGITAVLTLLSLIWYRQTTKKDREAAAKDASDTHTEDASSEDEKKL